MRVKILFNKKENALVQMSDSTQAQLGNTLHMCGSQVSQNLSIKRVRVLLHECCRNV